MISLATSFIRLQGYPAHARRRTSTGTGTGVSVEDVRQYLLKSIPGLAEERLSRTAVAYLFCPSNKCRKASKRYKGFIAARVPVKSDNIGKQTLMLIIYLQNVSRMK